jgi:two-component system, response regulator PdtaR
MTARAPTRQSPVLVVEDEELLRLYVDGFLEEAGFEVLDAPDADAALDIMARRPDVRVLFTDIQMPGAMNGMELARLVHEHWPQVLLLITSGNSRPSAAEIADHGHFLPKPYRADEVIREIHDLTQESDARLGPGPGRETGRQ